MKTSCNGSRCRETSDALVQELMECARE